MEENEIGSIVSSAAIAVHRALGPGLLESAYLRVLKHELQKRGLEVESEVPITIHYDGVQFRDAFRLDLRVNGKVILELKSVETLLPVHFKQLVTYLRLTGCRLGYLLNFGEALMKDGIHRRVNGLPED